MRPMKFTLTTVFAFSIFLLLSCGKSDKPTNDTGKADTDKTETKKTEKPDAKAGSSQVIVRKWKESFSDMYAKKPESKSDEFEQEEMKKAADNSFYEFKADGTYTIIKPDEEPGKGKWELSSDAKKLILHSAQGHKDELGVELVTADKLKLKIKGTDDVLVLIPA